MYMYIISLSVIKFVLFRKTKNEKNVHFEHISEECWVQNDTDNVKVPLIRPDDMVVLIVKQS